MRGQGVPLIFPVHADLHVILLTFRCFENLADVVAEVPLDFQDQRGGPALRILRLPAKQLPGKRVHASRGLTRADRPEDGDPGVEAPLRDHEPIRVGNLPAPRRGDVFPRRRWPVSRRMGQIGHGGSPPLPCFSRGTDSNQTCHTPEKSVPPMNTTTPGMRAYQPCASHRRTGAFEGHQRDDGVLRSRGKRTRNIPGDRGRNRKER